MKNAARLFIAFLACSLLCQRSSHAQTGITWTTQTPAVNNVWRGITFGAGLFVAVSSNGLGDRVMTSPDGLAWTSRSSAADNAWQKVTFGNGLFVAISSSGTGNRVMTSPDGITWTSQSSAADNSWQNVTYGNGLFVAVSNSGTGNRVMTSPDGITWTSRSSAADNLWRGVTYGNGLFVAVSSSGTGNRVMTSPDGITWTSRSSAADNSWNGVTYGNGLFVAVSSSGTGNRVMTSPDGITWTSRSSAADNSWNSVIYGNGLFVAVAQSGAGNRVMTSPDGITWTSRSSAADNFWYDIVYRGGIFVAVGSVLADGIMTSGTFSTLPLHWLSINGNLTAQDQAAINWKVTEQNVTGYAIEKSSDAVNYHSIGTIHSKGNGENSYVFTDPQPLTGKAYYRIQQTDIDGKFTYSAIVVMLQNSNQAKPLIYPNPVKDIVTITVGNDLLSKKAVLTDIQGRKLQTITISSLSFTMKMAGYPTGLYWLKLNNGDLLKIVKE